MMTDLSGRDYQFSNQYGLLIQRMMFQNHERGSVCSSLRDWHDISCTILSYAKKIKKAATHNTLISPVNVIPVE